MQFGTRTILGVFAMVLAVSAIYTRVRRKKLVVKTAASLVGYWKQKGNELEQWHDKNGEWTRIGAAPFVSGSYLTQTDHLLILFYVGALLYAILVSVRDRKLGKPMPNVVRNEPVLLIAAAVAAAISLSIVGAGLDPQSSGGGNRKTAEEVLEAIARHNKDPNVVIHHRATPVTKEVDWLAKPENAWVPLSARCVLAVSVAFLGGCAVGGIVDFFGNSGSSDNVDK